MIKFRARHVPADQVGDLLAHLIDRETAVEVEAGTDEITPAVGVKDETVECTAEAGIKVAHQGGDSSELRQLVGVLAAGNDSVVVAVGRGHVAEAGRAIDKNMAAGYEVAFSPVRDCFFS